MDKKVLIAIGVIAALGIGTYAIIVSRNKNKTTDESEKTDTGGYTKPPTVKPPTTPPTVDDSVETILKHLSCKYFKIGCIETAKNK